MRKAIAVMVCTALVFVALACMTGCGAPAKQAGQQTATQPTTLAGTWAITATMTANGMGGGLGMTSTATVTLNAATLPSQCFYFWNGGEVDNQTTPNCYQGTGEMTGGSFYYPQAALNLTDPAQSSQGMLVRGDFMEWTGSTGPDAILDFSGIVTGNTIQGTWFCDPASSQLVCTEQSGTFTATMQ